MSTKLKIKKNKIISSRLKPAKLSLSYKTAKRKTKKRRKRINFPTKNKIPDQPVKSWSWAALEEINNQTFKSFGN